MRNATDLHHDEVLLKLQPWLDAVVELLANDRDADPSAVRERCKAAVLAVRSTLRDDRLLREKEVDISRTLVAYLDEFGGKRFRAFGAWESLQSELYCETMLGDLVIDDMEQFCKERPRNDPERAFTYYLSLSLGFEGCYGATDVGSDGDRRLIALRLRLREALVEAGWFGPPAEHYDGPPPAGPPPAAAAPLWPWLVAFCVALAVMTELVALRHFSQQASGELEGQIKSTKPLSPPAPSAPGSPV